MLFAAKKLPATLDVDPFATFFRGVRIMRMMLAVGIALMSLLALALFGMVFMSAARAEGTLTSGAFATGHLAAGAVGKGLTIADCQIIFTGLTGLDGRQEVTKDNTPVQVPYQFGSAKLRMVIQQNIARLQDMQSGFAKVQQELFKEVAGASATEIKPNTPEMVKYQKLVLEAQQQPCNIDLQRIRAEDLKLDKNEIPGSVLGALDKILDR